MCLSMHLSISCNLPRASFDREECSGLANWLMPAWRGRSLLRFWPVFAWHKAELGVFRFVSD